ncbi:MAG: hypothetical protein ACYTKD_10830, partial [Planctomycetota bacterium]
MNVCGRDAEEPSVGRLVESIRAEFPRVNVSASPNENDPPDCFLNINGTNCAVEVASIMESVRVGGRVGKDISRRGYVSVFHRFLEKIEAEAKQKGLLRGTYSIKFTSRRHFTRKFRPKLQECLLHYLERTRDGDSGGDQLVVEGP